MKAIALEGYGIDNVNFIDMDDPQPGPGEVLVRVRAAALNHLDLWTLSGDLPLEHHFPHVLGADGAGEIAALGDDVKGLASGQRVLINPGMSCGGCEFCRAGEQSLCTTFHMLGEHVPGTFAELIKVPARNVFPFPEHLSFAEATALGVTFVTAYRMLFTRGRLRPGEWVLVTGIGGGLAQSLLQLARLVAGKVLVSSSSDEKLERAAELGADAGINYRKSDVGKQVRQLTGKRGVDLVVDSAGGSAIDPSLRALRKGGRLVIAGATAGGRGDVDVRRVFWNQLEVIGSTMGSNADVSDLLRLVAGTGLRPLIDRTFSLSGGRQALSYLGSGEHVGKVVLAVA
ncbi:MAG: alcohol dehydrogenase catalytic domain-containing protein [Actinomycetota bacterium]